MCLSHNIILLLRGTVFLVRFGVPGSLPSKPRVPFYVTLKLGSIGWENDFYIHSLSNACIPISHPTPYTVSFFIPIVSKALTAGISFISQSFKVCLLSHTRYSLLPSLHTYTLFPRSVSTPSPLMPSLPLHHSYSSYSLISHFHLFLLLVLSVCFSSAPASLHSTPIFSQTLSRTDSLILSLPLSISPFLLLLLFLLLILTRLPHTHSFHPLHIEFPSFFHLLSAS